MEFIGLHNWNVLEKILLQWWLDTGVRLCHRNLASLCSLSLAWAFSMLASRQAGPFHLVARGASSSLGSSTSLLPVRRASRSHKSPRCDSDSVGLSPVHLPESATTAKELAVAVLRGRRCSWDTGSVPKAPIYGWGEQFSKNSRKSGQKYWIATHTKVSP